MKCSSFRFYLVIHVADMTTSSSLRKSPKGQQQDCLERLLNLRRCLVEWWSTLPEVTNCRDLNPSGPLFRANVHLKLDYCLTRIFIGRPFLFSNIRGVNPATVSTPAPTAPFKLTGGTSKNRTIIVTDCIDAALEIVDLCRLLRDETGLARASFTEFSSCRAALLVILAQSLTKRTERLRESIDKGMALIKIMSMGVGSARSAVSVIEALERAIRRLEEWSVSRGGNGSNPGGAESAYDRFKSWEMLWKSGPLSPSISVPLSSGQDHIASVGGASSSNNPLPMTPMATAASAATANTTTGSGGDGTTTANIANPDAMLTTPAGQSSSANNSEYEPIPGQSAFSPANPHFAFDHFVSNFPQELDEFTAIPCFEIDGQQAQTSGQATGQTQQARGLGLSEGAPDTRWLEFINGD